MEWEAVSVGILSILPPVVAIVLALITKEVVFSLVLGILSGTVIYSFAHGDGVVGIFDTTSTLMADKLAGNTSMILFLCFLGILVAIINKAGGSKAYGDWAVERLKSRRSASVATGGLGILIFIDDYFNCLTVGTVMRPVTDRFNISREKLAYLIDATAAPICIIAPISSWAASVMSYYPESADMSGMTAFIRSIPMNLYAILTIIMVFYIAIKKNADYGPMLKAELLAEQGIQAGKEEIEDLEEELVRQKTNNKGRIYDLVIPICVLIVLCILSMLHVGGYWTEEGSTLFDAFGNTDAGPALSLGAFGALIFSFIYFMCRRVLSFRDFFECIGPGVKSMVPACIILTLAWAISGVCRDLLGTGPYVAHLVEISGVPVQILPALIFVVACLLAFSTGTAWGTFGILIPIIIAICEAAAPELLITTLSATLAGSVFGDHTSPISDTTILASTGAQCNHLKHVGTQVPYAVTVAGCCLIGYIVAGLTGGLGFGISTVITLGVSIVLLLVVLNILPKIFGKNRYQVNEAN
ncbi:Na+/H+ antiporter NhaC family protein [Anaerovorax odorimutans]|uniref:Na+/H+ antiporter NhaC family protein n=1 Tax=Anaerovorax odorimutans TaxID=109327 RepID=A0ABT1RS05_9FIRM|nr:Na+/H+ antiporter NhaC family protein [Anaerovorax odorimutans]MCQ4637945.1 Na+/H+ antiporter NhaC family protein [Anaerovorax odorimutans]